MSYADVEWLNGRIDANLTLIRETLQKFKELEEKVHWVIDELDRKGVLDVPEDISPATTDTIPLETENPPSQAYGDEDRPRVIADRATKERGLRPEGEKEAVPG